MTHKKPVQCSRANNVWGAIFGCTGKATSFERVETRYHGKWFWSGKCEVCASVDARHRTLTREQVQAELEAAQLAAGVRDYRLAQVAQINGRPVLVRTGTMRSNPAQFWGTCGVCERVFKVKHQSTSKHGFERPGIGYTLGKCYGQEMVAWEISPASAKEYLSKFLVPLHAEAVHGLKMFDTGKVIWIKRQLPQTFLQRRNGVPPEHETITPEHRDWSREFAHRRWGAQSKVKMIADDIKLFEKKIATWNAKPLIAVSPDDPTSKRVKTFRVVEKFKTVEEDGGPDLTKPIMTLAPGDDMFTPGFKDRLVPSGRFWSKSIKRKIPFYVAEDAVTGRKIAMGKTPEEAEAEALRKHYKLVR